MKRCVLPTRSALPLWGVRILEGSTIPTCLSLNQQEQAGVPPILLQRPIVESDLLGTTDRRSHSSDSGRLTGGRLVHSRLVHGRCLLVLYFQFVDHLFDIRDTLGKLLNRRALVLRSNIALQGDYAVLYVVVQRSIQLVLHE